jgi:hypothetical protein
MATEKKRREGSIITVTNDESAGVQMFNVQGCDTLYLYHTAQPDGPVGLSDSVKSHAAFHGMEQRVRDAGALGWNEEAKRYATPQEKHAAMKVLVDHYNSGTVDWNVKGGVSESGLLFRVLMREKPERDANQVKAFIKAQDAATRRKLLDSDRLIEIVRAIRKEDGSQFDADEILNSLD